MRTPNIAPNDAGCAVIETVRAYWLPPGAEHREDGGVNTFGNNRTHNRGQA
jgi:hypothetical protein